VCSSDLAPLSPDDQSRREAEQRHAHCNALPEDLLAGMTDDNAHNEVDFGGPVGQEDL
jgi:hypothetical protein